MTLQQLKYVIQIAQSGSINLAAQKLYISQPSLSSAVAELEKEMGITIFIRNNRGAVLTEEGLRFLSYARQVVEQADLLEGEYKQSSPHKRIFSVSAQHYAFVVNAFVSLVKEYGKDEYEFSLRETRTDDIIEDVRTRRSEIGVIFLSSFNRNIILGILKKAELRFTPLFTARPHVFVSAKNPLAGKSEVTLEDLKPFPRLTFEQGLNNSFYFAEEPHITEDAPKSIVVSDRASLFNLLIGLNGYTISSGILSSDLNGNEIVSVPLKSDEHMEIGYICFQDNKAGVLAERFVYHLKEYISHYSL